MSPTYIADVEEFKNSRINRLSGAFKNTDSVDKSASKLDKKGASSNRPSNVPKEEEYVNTLNQKKKVLEDMKTEEDKLKQRRQESLILMKFIS